MVDDSHATGVLGPTGRGTPEHLGVLDRVDIITSTLGKALGGAAGGFTCGRAEVVEYLRQRSRPYLFSNALPPPIAMAALKALELVGSSNELRDRLHANARRLRAGLEKAGFTLKPGQHPILPVMLGDAALASAHGRPAAGEGHLRDRLQLSRWCRRARRASASRCRRRTRRSRSTGPCRRSPPSARSWAVIGG